MAAESASTSCAVTLLSTDELVEYMSGIGLNADQAQASEDVLAGVQAELERYLGRPLELRVITERLVYDCFGWVQTAVTPVASTAIAGFGVIGGRLWGSHVLGATAGPVTIGGYAFPFTQTIAYTAGFDGRLPDFSDARLAILRVAAREVEQRHDDTRSVKDLKTRNEGEMQLRQKIGWQPDELARFDRLRRRVVA